MDFKLLILCSIYADAIAALLKARYASLKSIVYAVHKVIVGTIFSTNYAAVQDRNPCLREILPEQVPLFDLCFAQAIFNDRSDIWNTKILNFVLWDDA